MATPKHTGTEVKMDLGPLRKMIQKLATKASDFRPVWPLVDKYTTLVMVRQFSTEGAFLGGSKWRPWTRKWALYRGNALRKKGGRTGGGRGGIGRDFGDMWASFTKHRGPESVTRMDRQEYERGSIVTYAKHFQKRRPVWPETLPPEVENTYLKILVKYLDDAKAAA